MAAILRHTRADYSVTSLDRDRRRRAELGQPVLDDLVRVTFMATDQRRYGVLVSFSGYMRVLPSFRAGVAVLASGS